MLKNYLSGLHSPNIFNVFSPYLGNNAPLTALQLATPIWANPHPIEGIKEIMRNDLV
jgi:hypothetical protein